MAADHSELSVLFHVCCPNQLHIITSSGCGTGSRSSGGGGGGGRGGRGCSRACLAQAHEVTPAPPAVWAQTVTQVVASFATHSGVVVHVGETNTVLIAVTCVVSSVVPVITVLLTGASSVVLSAVAPCVISATSESAPRSKSHRLAVAARSCIVELQRVCASAAVLAQVIECDVVVAQVVVAPHTVPAATVVSK